MTYLTPAVNAEGEFKGDLDEPRHAASTRQGLVGRRRLPEFVQTTSYAVDLS